MLTITFSARSPMIGYLNSTLEGLSTVRATENQTILRKEFDRHQDHFTSTNFMLICSTRAFGLWLDIMASLYVTFVVLRFVFFSEGIRQHSIFSYDELLSIFNRIQSVLVVRKCFI